MRRNGSSDGLAHLLRTDIILVRTAAACEGAAEAARRLGLMPVLLSNAFEGESGALGRNFAAMAKQVLLDGNPVAAPCVLIGGGETTVIIDGEGGEGGPNQEFAASAALYLEGVGGVVALGIDTDGTDGPRNMPAPSSMEARLLRRAPPSRFARGSARSRRHSGIDTHRTCDDHRGDRDQRQRPEGHPCSSRHLRRASARRP